MAGRAYHGTKIVAVAKNFAKHKVEMGGTADKLERPVFFLKPSSSVIAQGSPIVRPRDVVDLHHEVELGVVIGRRCSRMPASAWRGAVGGYVLALDMTARCLQAEAKRGGMPWTQAKCYDTFTPLSHIVLPAAPGAGADGDGGGAGGTGTGGGGGVAGGRVADPHALELYLFVDGVERQRGSTGGMLARIPELLEAISAVMTLEEGDVVLTGTPEGVGPVLPGQTIRAGITGLVEVTFPVVQGE